VQQVFLIAKIDGADSGKPGPDLEDLCLIFFSKGVKAPLIYRKQPLAEIGKPLVLRPLARSPLQHLF
jgi:hypothetical protein